MNIPFVTRVAVSSVESQVEFYGNDRLFMRAGDKEPVLAALVV